MASKKELMAAVADLLAEEPQLPPPAERARLREAAGITQARMAAALGVTEQTVKNWENGRSEPKGARLEAYQHLLGGWAERYPAHPAPAAAPVATVPVAAPAPAPAAAVPVPGPAADGAAARQRAAGRPAGRRAAAGSGAAAVVDAAYPNGPLAVLDGEGRAYGIGGRALDCPAATVAELVDWTLTRSGLGASRLHRSGRDADPLIVLTAQAAARLGLPERLQDRRGLRLADDHPVVGQLLDEGWKLTQRGFGPWARIYRPAQDGRRQCVQLAVLPWDALDERAWPGVAEMDPEGIARVLGLYARRVMTPVGPTATTGLELMTALRPPTRAVQDPQTGRWVSGHNPGSLGTQPLDPAPPEASPDHPVVVGTGWSGGFLDEEAYQWVRDVELLSGGEASLPWAVGLDLNTAFLASSARLVVGLSAPEYVRAPVFDKRIPGSWRADLSHIELDPRLPSPFTPTGERPTGPAWYQTHTIAYAHELGYTVQPTEAYLRRETGAYLDPWHDRLKAAYVDTLADLGVTSGVTDAEFLEAMERAKAGDPELRAVLAAIKSTVKGGIGKLRQGPQGRHHRPGDPWPALSRPTWRPDIRAAVISKARVNMHRKMLKMAEVTGLYPLAVLSDCVVYPSPGPSPLDILPYSASGKPIPGPFRLGPTPGLAKVEGVQPMPWAVDLMEQGYNPARHIKGDGHDARLDDGE
ncbi:transcriptional regulator [Streptomyces sp. PBH53]|uniref:telomere-associated protein Tap n=1 Tax=Streptomyces sp. PBH53 TaxID=1577075 RepID=UPI000655C275|nr:helix-turn-helix transcriptional regulator [Streptomyces sp. PBH53]AKN74994.1 transcriptional regulator [Streptomyces sp. PBH53]